jgi:hypothetical protein
MCCATTARSSDLSHLRGPCFVIVRELMTHGACASDNAVGDRRAVRTKTSISLSPRSRSRD